MLRRLLEGNIWAVGLLGVVTCLADRTADRFKSDTVHQVYLDLLFQTI